MGNKSVTMQEVHSYLKLVRAGLADPILCPFDDSPTYCQDQDGPVFICLECHAKIKPGFVAPKS